MDMLYAEVLLARSSQCMSGFLFECNGIVHRGLRCLDKKAVQNVLKYAMLKQVQVDQNLYFSPFFMFFYRVMDSPMSGSINFFPLSSK